MRRWGMVTRAVLALALTLGGCFTPELTEGLPCSEQGDCPGDQRCVPGQHVCTSDPPAQARFTQISAGLDHTCAIDTADELYCWGSNFENELGIPGEARGTPTLVDSATWESIGTGTQQTCGLHTDHTLWCWGLDLATIGPDPTPTQVGTESWEQLAVGDLGMCAVRSDTGAVWCAFDSGGDFVEVTSETGWTALTTSGEHTCGIRDGGRLFCWGANDSGEVGNGMAGADVTVPFETGAGDVWRSVSAGEDHTAAVKEDGTVWCWGENLLSQCADDEREEIHSPARVPDLVSIDQVRTKYNHTCANDFTGRTWCWGVAADGQLGDGVADELAAPREVTGVALAGLTTGNRHTCGLELDGDAWCWGNDSYGQLGDGVIGLQREPVALTTVGNTERVGLGERHGCAIGADGRLACWGRNGHGQVGDGSTRQRSRPVVFAGGQRWLHVAGGVAHTCAIADPGTLWCWGANDAGQLGVGDLEDRHEPTQVEDREDWVTVQAGSDFTCAIDADEAMWCWGGDTDPFTTPQLLDAGPGWSGLSFSPTPTNRAVSTVLNGQLRRVRPDFSSGPDDSVSDLVVASGNNFHNCGIRANEEVWCFGDESYGELGGPGDGSTWQPVAGPAGWTEIAAAEFHTCGIRDGDLLCWGRNLEGQVGDGSDTDQRDVPSPIARDGAWSSIAVTRHTSCAIDGTELFCWGYSQLLAGGWDVPVWVAPPVP